jgi:hypothetical protein
MLLDMPLDVGDKVCKTVNIRTDSGYVLLCHDNDAQLQSDFEYIIKLQPTMFDVEPEEEEGEVQVEVAPSAGSAVPTAAIHTESRSDLFSGDTFIAVDNSSSPVIVEETEIEDSKEALHQEQRGSDMVGDGGYITELSPDLVNDADPLLEPLDTAVHFTGENIDTDGVSLHRELIYEGEKDVTLVRKLLSRALSHKAVRVAFSASIKLIFLYALGISIAYTLPFLIRK